MKATEEVADGHTLAPVDAPPLFVEKRVDAPWLWDGPGQVSRYGRFFVSLLERLGGFSPQDLAVHVQEVDTAVANLRFGIDALWTTDQVHFDTQNGLCTVQTFEREHVRKLHGASGVTVIEAESLNGFIPAIGPLVRRLYSHVVLDEAGVIDFVKDVMAARLHFSRRSVKRANDWYPEIKSGGKDRDLLFNLTRSLLHPEKDPSPVDDTYTDNQLHALVAVFSEGYAARGWMEKRVATMFPGVVGVKEREQVMESVFKEFPVDSLIAQGEDGAEVDMLYRFREKFALLEPAVREVKYYEDHRVPDPAEAYALQVEEAIDELYKERSAVSDRIAALETQLDKLNDQKTALGSHSEQLRMIADKLAEVSRQTAEANIVLQARHALDEMNDSGKGGSLAQILSLDDEEFPAGFIVDFAVKNFALMRVLYGEGIQKQKESFDAVDRVKVVAKEFQRVIAKVLLEKVRVDLGDALEQGKTRVQAALSREPIAVSLGELLQGDVEAALTAARDFVKQSDIENIPDVVRVGQSDGA